MSHRDEQQDEGFASDADFIRGGGREGRTGSAPQRRPSALRRVLRVLVFLMLVVIVLGGGLYLAIQYRIIDPAAFGLDDVFADGGGSTARPAVVADVIFSGDATALSAAPGNTIQTDPSGDAVWLRSTVKSASTAGATDGVSAVIPPELLPRFEGRRVRVTISAKSGAEGTPIPFAAAYSAGTKGNSNWIVFVPEKMFTDHTFSFVIPIGEIGATDETHRVAIWPDIEGRASPLAIRSITIQPD